MSGRSPRTLVRSPQVLAAPVLSLVSVWLAAITALACVSATPSVSVAPQPTHPDWFLAPPPDTRAAYFGVGSDLSLEGAKSKALVDVASKIAVSVRSTYRDTTVLHNDDFDQRIESDLEARVRDREFKGYEVVESAVSLGTYYSLVRVDRVRLFQDSLASFRELDWEVQAPLSRAAHGTALGYYLAYGELESAIERASSAVRLLRTLNPNFNDTATMTAYRDYRGRYELARSKLVFTLLPDEGSAEIARIVQELLSARGLKTESASDAGGACRNLCVEISSSATHKFAARRHLATVDAIFRIRDADRGISVARHHQMRGSALNGHEEARMDAVRGLRTEFVRTGILFALGLESSADGLASATTTRPPH